MTRILALAPLWVYRRLVSPLLPASCRFYPSCSAYAEEAVRLHGLGRGCWLALRRLLRCHPWTPGGVDHVPGHHFPEHQIAEQQEARLTSPLTQTGA